MLLIAAGLVLAMPVQAQLYKWVDEQGHVHYGDCPPPECEPIEIPPPPAPAAEEVERAQERLKRMLEEQRERAEIRRQAEEAERLKREAEERIAAYRRSRCQLAQQNLHTLRLGRPVYRIDEKGERVFLDDAERAAEIERMKEDIREYCD